MYTLHCLDSHSNAVSLRYDPRNSEFVNLDGTAVIQAPQATRPNGWEPAHQIAPHSQGVKSTSPTTLKIQLGLACNYACTYCNQSSQIDTMAASRTADAYAFLADLDQWLTQAPTLIELWGGEPLLYFAKLQILVPELDRRFPDAELSIVTNGSLLTEEILQFLIQYDIRVTMSHDGPGQGLRGEDPFADPRLADLIGRLWRDRKPRNRMTFSSVITPGNSDPHEIRRWFVNQLEDEEVLVTFEGVVAVHDDRTLAGPGRWTPSEYASLRESVAHSFETGEALKIPALWERARDFVQSVVDQRPATSLGQRCGMDREDQLAVDLHSNVLTCHNTGAQGKHGLGSALRMAEVQLDTATHWSHRESCSHCPVLQMCRGSCMYLEGDQFAQSCENEYQFGLGVLDGVLRRALGLRLQSIEGDIRRPVVRRRIPIAVATTEMSVA